MNTSVTVLTTAVIAGLLLGSLARPLSWRLFGGVLAFGVAFFVFELGRASWLGTSVTDLVQVIVLSSTPALQRYLGAMAIAYAAILAAAVIALRLVLARRKASYEA
jgi:hypothetical protein